MRADSTGKSKSGFQVTTQILYLFNVFYELAINSLLDLFGFSSPVGFCCFSSFCFLGSCFWGILQLIFGKSDLSFEVSLIDISCDSIKRDSCWCCNYISWVDSFQWYSIDGIRPSDEEVAWWQCFQNNYSSSSMCSREKNNNWSGLDWFSACAWLWLISSSF